MGNSCIVSCCPCCPCSTDYSDYDYLCENPDCQKKLEPEQELYIINNNMDGKDYIYCSRQCTQKN